MSVDSDVNSDRLADYPGWCVMWKPIDHGELFYLDSKMIVLDQDHPDRRLALEHALVHLQFHLTPGCEVVFTPEQEEQADFLAAVRLDRVTQLCDRKGK